MKACGHEEPCYCHEDFDLGTGFFWGCVIAALIWAVVEAGNKMA
tara:strand:+ start:1455 stop:1586 length:132 start_codon:yes stop_codon:yes gene_type:complete